LRPFIASGTQDTSQQDADSAEPQRSRIAIRAQSQPEKLSWELDDSKPPRSRTKMTPVSAKSGTAVRPAGYRYSVRQAGGRGQEPLQLQPASEGVDEPTPVEPDETTDAGPAHSRSSEVPSRPRSFVSKHQPKKAEAAPDFKCPSRAELMKPICELGVNITPSKGEMPEECPLLADAFEPRMWCDSLYMWKASALCHKPLYFEHMSLERYGHSWHPFEQPFVSAAHFFGSIPILPYKMGIEDPCECVYALGYYRPGNCAPKMLYPLPLSVRGAVYQAAAVTGVVFLLP
jgi:hypothetical protein